MMFQAEAANADCTSYQVLASSSATLIDIFTVENNSVRDIANSNAHVLGDLA